MIPQPRSGKANQGNCPPAAFQMTNRITCVGTNTATWSQNH
jgi:hypothetical protein